MTEQPIPTPPNKPSRALIVFLIVPILGIIIALAMVATENTRTAPALPNGITTNQASLINFNAPLFELSLLEGETVSLEQYRGKVLFLNFWQTTCEPCKREMPTFADFLADYGEEANILAINFDETPEQIQAFLDEYNIQGVPIALDESSRTRRSYGIANIPVTFIIDANGIVRNMKLGEMTYENMVSYLNEARPN